MECLECRAVNPEGKRFCRECGAKLTLICPQCGAETQPSDKFCGECGRELAVPGEPPSQGLRQDTPRDLAEAHPPQRAEDGGERKQVTVLFSDLSGYTSMTERLDPEDVKEIISRIFGEIAQVVAKYDGFIEKFIGDAVVAVFGVPRAHEDAPLRAIRTAQEVHDLVKAMSLKHEARVGRPLAMHSGIDTGLVVAGDLDPVKGSHGLLGDALNVASRLSNLAKPDEILVGRETYRQAEGHFHFDTLRPATVKGKADPLQLYRVLSAKERPVTVHRPSGLRADLIGRRAELLQLGEAVRRLREGKGTIVSICGEAGTGKSRLIEEFRGSLDLGKILWLEGHAHAYSQNIPYSPLIDLLNRAWAIEEGDPPERVREKVESNLEPLIGKSKDVVPYIGGLYALPYPEAEGVSPEYWKSRLFEAVSGVLGTLARGRPAVICLEDIHWADPSSLELLRFVLLESRHPALFIFGYRPPFVLFSSHQISSLAETYQEILLQDLSPSDIQDMMESLLGTRAIPPEMRKYVQEKVEGNPFYIEEIISSLIESGSLTQDSGTWRLTRPIADSDIPPTIQGAISARLDRLEKEMKRVLQEASVIGRAFLYEILQRITRLRDQMDLCLLGLERLDLIRSRSMQPELEYIFKHALTQEVVYGGLLKKERQELHGRIGRVMEEIFQPRLPEFYETLAYHYGQAGSPLKMVDYLVKSGEKSLKRYALEESNGYFAEAYEALFKKEDKSAEEKRLLIDLLVRWAFVFYYRGDFRALLDLLGAHVDTADSLADKALEAMFHGWFGFAMACGGRVKDSYRHLRKAIELGEEARDEKSIGYACAWLTWTCMELGLLDEAERYGEKAQEIAKRFPSDPYVYFKSLGGLGMVYFNRGDKKRTLETAQILLDYGRRHGNIRSQVLGYGGMGCAHLIDGDFPSALVQCEKAGAVAADPLYMQLSNVYAGFVCALMGDLDKAQSYLVACVNFADAYGCEVVGTPARLFLGMTKLFKGDMGGGIKLVEAAQSSCLENGRRLMHVMSEQILGRVYLGMVERSGPKGLSVLAQNAAFLLRHFPFASQKAEKHLNSALEIAREIGAKPAIAAAQLYLAQLHSAKGRKEQAKGCILEAIRLFEECDAQHYLKEAEEVLASLE